MRIVSTIAVAVLAASLGGCLSYSKHEREDRVIEHRSGSHRAEGYDRHGGYHRSRHDHYRRDHDWHHGGHDRHHGDRYRHHPRGH